MLCTGSIGNINHLIRTQNFKYCTVHYYKFCDIIFGWISIESLDYWLQFLKILGHQRIMFGEQYDPNIHDIYLHAGIGICWWKESKKQNCSSKVSYICIKNENVYIILE